MKYFINNAKKAAPSNVEEKSEKEDVKIKSKEKSTKTIQEIDREKLDKKFKKKNK